MLGAYASQFVKKQELKSLSVLTNSFWCQNLCYQLLENIGNVSYRLYVYLVP